MSSRGVETSARAPDPAGSRLTHYWAKRDFKKTAEPRGEQKGSGSKLSFVIQKHAASRLHYDFRLELDGVLVSWAVPEGTKLRSGRQAAGRPCRRPSVVLWVV